MESRQACIEKLVESGLAAAEVAAANSPHPPTAEFFKGQVIAYKKVAAWLQIEKENPVSTLHIDRHIRISASWQIVTIVFFSFIAGALCILF